VTAVEADLRAAGALTKALHRRFYNRTAWGTVAILLVGTALVPVAYGDPPWVGLALFVTAAPFVVLAVAIVTLDNRRSRLGKRLRDKALEQRAALDLGRAVAVRGVAALWEADRPFAARARLPDDDPDALSGGDDWSTSAVGAATMTKPQRSANVYLASSRKLSGHSGSDLRFAMERPTRGMLRRSILIGTTPSSRAPRSRSRHWAIRGPRRCPGIRASRELRRCLGLGGRPQWLAAPVVRTRGPPDECGLRDDRGELSQHRDRARPGRTGQLHDGLNNCQRVVVNGFVKNEGDVQVGVPRPFAISFRSIVPQRTQCANLTVPVCLAASHIAYGSIRMEPVFMILAQSAATAAILATMAGVAVQDLPYPQLQSRLRADMQLLEWPANPVDETIVDSRASTGVTRAGTWLSSTSIAGYYGSDYEHDDNTGKGVCRLRFRPTLPAAGSYSVQLRWTAHANRASNVPVDIEHSAGIATHSVDQRSSGGQWVPLGTYAFAAGTGGSLLIRTEATNGYVVADAVRFVRV
jgi:hypothetical protein